MQNGINEQDDPKQSSHLFFVFYPFTKSLDFNFQNK